MKKPLKYNQSFNYVRGLKGNSKHVWTKSCERNYDDRLTDTQVIFKIKTDPTFNDYDINLFRNNRICSHIMDFIVLFFIIFACIYFIPGIVIMTVCFVINYQVIKKQEIEIANCITKYRNDFLKY